MKSALRSGAIVIMLACGAGPAAAAGSNQLNEPTMDETTGSIASPPRGALPLSDEQRFRIYDGVMRIPDAPLAHVQPPDLAEALPRGVELQDLPASVTRAVPMVNDHKFVKFDDRILVVNPENRLVVAM